MGSAGPLNPELVQPFQIWGTCRDSIHRGKPPQKSRRRRMRRMRAPLTSAPINPSAASGRPAPVAPCQHGNERQLPELVGIAKAEGPDLDGRIDQPAPQGEEAELEEDRGQRSNKITHLCKSWHKYQLFITGKQLSLDETIVLGGVLCCLIPGWRSAFPASARRMSRDFVKPVTSAKLDSASNSKSVTLIVTSRDRRSHSRGDRYASDSWSFRYCSCRYSAAARSASASRLTTSWNRGIGSTARQIP